MAKIGGGGGQNVANYSVQYMRVTRTAIADNHNNVYGEVYTSRVFKFACLCKKIILSFSLHCTSYSESYFFSDFKLLQFNFSVASLSLITSFVL